MQITTVTVFHLNCTWMWWIYDRNSCGKSQEIGVKEVLISVFLVVSLFQVVDAFMAARPLPNMFDWMRNNAGFHQASVEESTVAFIFQARLQSGHDKNSLLNILDDVQTSVAFVRQFHFFDPTLNMKTGV